MLVDETVPHSGSVVAAVPYLSSSLSLHHKTATLPARATTAVGCISAVQGTGARSSEYRSGKCLVAVKLGVLGLSCCCSRTKRKSSAVI